MSNIRIGVMVEYRFGKYGKKVGIIVGILSVIGVAIGFYIFTMNPVTTNTVPP